MKKSITLALGEAELIELQQILLNEDQEAAMRFLETHVARYVRTLVSGGGH